LLTQVAMTRVMLRPESVRVIFNTLVTGSGVGVGVGKGSGVMVGVTVGVTTGVGVGVFVALQPILPTMSASISNAVNNIARFFMLILSPQLFYEILKYSYLLGLFDLSVLKYFSGLWHLLVCCDLFNRRCNRV